jgi:hypothetical protein
MRNPVRHLKRLILPSVIAAGLVLFAGVAWAQSTDQFGLSYGTYTGLVSTDPRILIANIIRIALGVLGIVAIILVLYAGFLWMSAAGDVKKVDQAKRLLTEAVIGLIIIVSAFAIVSYIFSQLSLATNGGGGGGSGGGGGGGGIGGSGQGFRITAITPSGTLKKRDVIASVTFSAAPTGDVSNIKANIILEKLVGSNRTNVDYDPTVERNTIRLKPRTPCPDPNAEKACLDADADYQVTVEPNLTSATGEANINCGISGNCSARFHTGDVVATKLPTVQITTPTDGQSIRADSLVQVQALLSDDNGISNVDYLADGAFYQADGNVTDLGSGNYSSQVSWDDAGLVPVKSVNLTAEVTNIDGDQGTTPGVTVVIRPAHCFSGVKDADETGTDCGGADCGACTGNSCKTNADCASGQCVAGECVDQPVIYDVQLRDGKPGNLVTVTGDRFGSVPGHVVFLGATGTADDKDGGLAACGPAAWGNNRIIVTVPDGAVSGPIEVVTAANKTDATNDNYGPIVQDFTVNAVARPGICSVNPFAIAPHHQITLGGVAFGNLQADSHVTFTVAASTCATVSGTPYDAGVVSPWSDLSMTPTVPNVPTDATDNNYNVAVDVGGQPSNPVCLDVVSPDTGTLPRIESLSPTQGPVGTYLTLSGTNFGTSGKVKFTRAGQVAYGDTSFPAACNGGQWDSDTAVVKVPAQFTVPANTALILGDYAVSIMPTGSPESNSRTFTVNTDPLGPGICRINPPSGPANIGVIIYGESLGTVSASDLPGVLASYPDSVSFYQGQGATAVSQWTDNSVTAAVPTDASTGPTSVNVHVAAKTLTSNFINFQVKDCREAKDATNACDSGLTCCPDGACRTEGSCAESANHGGYAWRFSTGPIPNFPIVLEDATCQPTATPIITPSPNPFRDVADVCTDIGIISLRFSLPMDPTTAVSSNVIFEDCGTGDKIGTCTAAVPPPGIGLANYGDLQGNQLNLSVHGLTASTWYRVTLKSSDKAGFRSLAAPDRTSESLDGDFDGKGGGDYITDFKTGTGPCTLAGVDVQPSAGKIISADAQLGYQAYPLSDKCIILQCGERTTAWASSDTNKATLAPMGGVGLCQTNATPVAETSPGPAIQISCVMEGKTGQGDLTIEYAKPIVTDYAPKNCQDACPNAVSWAKFNVNMATSGPGSVLVAAHLKRCQNESCLAYVSDTPVTVVFNDALKRLELSPTSNMEPDAFYRVSIDGQASSSSGAPLDGLNFGHTFSWIFRTRADGNPCGPQKIAIMPPVTTLNYVGEIAEVTADPLTSPDTCSAEGELLSSASLNWGWTASSKPPYPTPPPPSRISILPYDPTTLPALLQNNLAALPPNCSTQCLWTGSAPAGTPVCGNGIVEKGEACDTPGSKGCTDHCLRTGNTNVGTGSGQCGDGTVDSDSGEACDAGADNGKPGSGCSEKCLFTGSVPGLSNCGNGSQGVGEECDEGKVNGQPGSGCTTTCLLTGSNKGVVVCGNGQLESGEECDYVAQNGVASALIVQGQTVQLVAGNQTKVSAPDFPCTNNCLLRGAGPKTCGNGVVDYATGEACDAGALNGKPGSGCSVTCLKTGSTPELHAYCGDTKSTVQSSIKDGAQNGGGEECEASALAAYPTATQYVTGKAECDAKNSCTASVVASVGKISGTGAVSVECSCTSTTLPPTDSCQIFGSQLACGTDGCCYKLPAAPVIEPHGGDQCRNVAVTITFPEEMDQSSLTGNTVVYKKVAGCTPPTFPVNLSGSPLARAFRAVKNFIVGLFGGSASAAPATCPVAQGTFTPMLIARTDKSTYTQVNFAPAAAYDATSTYVIVVQGGAKGARTKNGIGYGDDQSQEFTTGSNVCKLDVLAIDPPTELVQSSSQIYDFKAQAISNAGVVGSEIVPIPNVYAWTVGWAVNSATGTAGTKLDLLVESGPQADYLRGYQAKAGKNGQAQVIAVATITANTLFSKTNPVGTAVSGKSDVTIMICDNPWPARATDGSGKWTPYYDPETHFKIYYCRDNASGDLLPELRPAPVQTQSSYGEGLLGFCASTKAPGEPNQPQACSNDAGCPGDDNCLGKDLLFSFMDPRIRDAIGVRVYQNDAKLPPQEWYAAQKFQGSVSEIAVDGYRAVQDTHTTYVTAADKYGDPALKSYVYVLGDNDTASAATTNIYSQILQNITFNGNMTVSDVVNVCKLAGSDQALKADDGSPFVSCSTDLDCFNAFKNPDATMYCDSPKDKLQRDLRRWQDLGDMAASLDSGFKGTGTYPTFDSGSYIRGMTTSKWPSWSGLGAAGSAVDPVNAFLNCSKFGYACSVTGAECTPDTAATDCGQTTPGNTCVPKFDANTCFNQKSELFMCPAKSFIYRYQSIGGMDYELSAELEDTQYQWASGCTDLDSSICRSHNDCVVTASGCLPRSGTGTCSGLDNFDCSIRRDCHWQKSDSTCQDRFNFQSSCTGVFNNPVETCNGSSEGTTCTSDAQCAQDQLCLPLGVAVFGNSIQPRCGDGIVEPGELCELGTLTTIPCGSGQSAPAICSSDCQSLVQIGTCPAPAACGNGAIEQGESCDDGARNGQYGTCRPNGANGNGCAKHCVNITQRSAFSGSDIGDSCTTNADCGANQACTDRYQFCGDGVKNGPESCDEGADNGKYGHCAWDCSGAGPRCGDNLVNGNEECDGNNVSAPGLCHDGVTLCSKDADCPSGGSCQLCPKSPEGLPQSISRNCYPPGTSQQCTLTVPSPWPSSCKPTGSCGNGIIEGNEQCDDAKANSPAAKCLPNCRKNTCGDGFVYAGVEQCDNGASNGVSCVPGYGSTCTYCTTQCTPETVTGGYCGDKVVQVPPSGPESCDTGTAVSWCSNTYTTALQNGNIKPCHTDGDCAQGVCKSYLGSTTGGSCHSYKDCATGQYCSGGEGTCLSNNLSCTPDPYSNTVGTSATNPLYHDGSCFSCLSQCRADTGKSQKFCGDGLWESDYELCEGTGDPTATGAKKTFYGCLTNCNYDPASGNCGDGTIQANEECDGTKFASGSAPTCQSQGWGNDGAVGCGTSCQLYGGGCVDGALSPGDVRIKVEWTGGDACSDNDTHIILPSSGGGKDIGYGGDDGNGSPIVQDPHVWWSWDDTGANRGNFTSAGPKGTYPNPHGLELMTINWRKGDQYWPSSASDAYELYIYNWTGCSGNFKNMRVTACVYSNSPGTDGKHADCSRTFDGPTTNGTGAYWHVFNLWGSNDVVPHIDKINKFGSCSKYNMDKGGCSAIGL